MTPLRAISFALGLLIVATLAAYSNSLTGAFVFDDRGSIVDNASLRDWRTALLHAPADHGQTVGGRPVVNLSFALNYALGQLDPRGYHVANGLIHLAAALLLFGIVRRTLRVRPTCSITETDAIFAATAIALLWALHPLQTAAVTYVVQRAESLCSVFYLLTIYSVLRGAVAAKHGWGWYGLAVIACALGMGCKEVMVTAPLVVFLFDRAFLAGNASEAFRKRGLVYAALASTWLVLGVLVFHNPDRAGSVGFGSAIPWNDYALTQIGAVVHYLQLTLWPRPLIFDYGTPVVHDLVSVWPQAAILGVLGVASIGGLVRNRAWGFLGCTFFLLLSPSSSVVPVATQTMAEHRMYLALATVSAFAVLALHRLISNHASGIGCALALVLGVATFARNQDYRSPLVLWQDTAGKVPENPRAQLNAGVELAKAGQNDLALPRFKAAVRLAPSDSDARNNFANALKSAGQWDEAIEQYTEAVRLGPRNGKARLNFGRSLAARARWREAGEQFIEAAKIEPSAEPHIELGRTHIALNQLNEAEKDYRAALSFEPNSAPALAGLGEIFARTQRLSEAETTLLKALKNDPSSAAAHNHLGNVYLLTRRPNEALTEFQAALPLAPNSSITYLNTGIALIALHRRDEAQKAFEEAARLDPGNQRVKEILARLKSSPK